MANQATPIAALQELGFSSVGQGSYGLWKGYAVTLRLDHGYYWVDFAVRPPRLDRALSKALAASVRAAYGKRTVINFAAAKGKAISFQLRFDRKTPFREQFAAFADACVQALREQGITPAETCAICGAASPESLCVFGTYQPVHASCMRSLLEETKEKAEENQVNGSYALGLVGALLGMLVGLIPNLLLGVLTDRIYALLFALVPLAAMWLYRKFNGKMSKGSIAIIIVVSLLGVFVMKYFEIAIMLVQEHGFALGEALGTSAELFFDSEIFGAVMSDSIMYFVFMAIGILFAWRYLNQTNSGSIAGVEAALSTLRPNPDAAQETQDF